MNFGWLKRYVPRSLFGRTVLILLVPIITIQLVVSYVFIERLYQNVTAQMTNAVVLDVRHVLAADSRSELQARGEALGIVLAAVSPEDSYGRRSWFDLSGAVVDDILLQEIPGAIAVDLLTDDRRVMLFARWQDEVLALDFARNRVSASNPHQLLVLMVLVSLIVTLISFLFLRNQVKPITQLAEAASAFGKGRVLPYRPRGASEVRLAGREFLEMRARIERYLEQRTMMLSGVSHDLRTPLTRLKLGLSMVEGDEIKDLQGDVAEMEGMLDTFLDFARDEAQEATEPCDPAEIVRRVHASTAAGERLVLGDVDGGTTVQMRPRSVERALQNLVGNALRYGTAARLSLAVTDKSVRFRIEDDGPGIPEDKREEAIKPFSRLDDARNQNRGSGVGLGLAIVSDIARQHGGMLKLGRSEALGGLQADLVLAR